MTKKFGAKHTAMNGNANCEKSRKISKKINRFTSARESIMMKKVKIDENCEEFLGMFSRKITKVDKNVPNSNFTLPTFSNLTHIAKVRQLLSKR